MNTQQNDPKATSGGTPYRRTSDQLVSVQLIGTIFGIVLAFIGFQYQTGKIVSDITSKIASQDGKISSIQDDIKEIRETVKELERANRYPR